MSRARRRCRPAHEVRAERASRRRRAGRRRPVGVLRPGRRRRRRPRQRELLSRAAGVLARRGLSAVCATSGTKPPTSCSPRCSSCGGRAVGAASPAARARSRPARGRPSPTGPARGRAARPTPAPRIRPRRSGLRPACGSCGRRDLAEVPGCARVETLGERERARVQLAGEHGEQRGEQRLGSGRCRDADVGLDRAAAGPTATTGAPVARARSRPRRPRRSSRRRPPPPRRGRPRPALRPVRGPCGRGQGPGGDVGDLGQLERDLRGRSQLHAPADHVHAVGRGSPQRSPRRALEPGQRRLRGVGRSQRRGHRLAPPGRIAAEQGQRRQRPRVSLGRRDRALLACADDERVSASRASVDPPAFVTPPCWHPPPRPPSARRRRPASRRTGRCRWRARPASPPARRSRGRPTSSPAVAVQPHSSRSA